MIGIEERDTQTGIHVIRVHYTADALKREESVLNDLATGMKGGRNGRDWKREMEIDWTIASGLGVYSESFVREWHVAKEQLLADPKRPIIRGWDLGPTHVLPACAWAQLDSLGRLNGLHELATWDGRGEQPQCSVPAFIENVITESNLLFPGVEWIDYCDSAGWVKSQTDERACVDIMHEMGVYPRPGLVSMIARRRAIEGLLEKHVGGRAAMLLSPGMQLVIEGFAGQYKFEEIGETGRYKGTVDKNAHSHPMNAWEYIVGGVYGVKKSGDERKPRPEVKRDKMTGY